MRPAAILCRGLLSSECRESGAHGPISCGRPCSRLLKMTVCLRYGAVPCSAGDVSGVVSLAYLLSSRAEDAGDDLVYGALGRRAHPLTRLIPQRSVDGQFSEPVHG